MTIELHTWNTPNGRKISVALEEMGLPYKVVPVNITKGEQMAPGFLKLSPNNKIPAILTPRVRTASRSASSNPARSCSISAKRPANSCRNRSARASPSMNG